MSHKRSVVRSLFLRARKLCSPQFLDDEISYIKTVLRQNYYPIKFIENVLHSISNRNNQSEIQAPAEPPKYVSAPYIKGTSERLGALFSKYNIRLGNKPPATLRQILSHPKDKNIPITESCVIYELPCQDCENKYIGETSNNLHTRIAQHKANVRRGETNSLVFQHMLNSGHDMNWNEPKILNKNNRTGPRKFLEACHSINEPLSFNRRIDVADVFLPLI